MEKKTVEIQTKTKTDIISMAETVEKNKSEIDTKYKNMMKMMELNQRQMMAQKTGVSGGIRR